MLAIGATGKPVLIVRPEVPDDVAVIYTLPITIFPNCIYLAWLTVFVIVTLCDKVGVYVVHAPMSERMSQEEPFQTKERLVSVS
jgi:hypothetical protein